VRKIKKNLIIGFVSLGLSVLSVIMVIVLFITTFLFGSLSRYGISSKWYYYPSHNYYYAPNYENLIFSKNIIEKDYPGVFLIWYGITKFHQRQVLEPDGEMILLRGPPFYFQIHIMRFNRDINHFHFKEISMETDSGEKYDLFHFLDTISGSFGNEEREHSGDEEDVDAFLQTKKLYTNNYIVEGVKISERRMSLILNFWDIPIDYKNNENVTIHFVFDVVMDNGEIINYVFDDIYERNYEFVESEASASSPDKFGKDDWNKSLSNGTFKSRKK
jgi:hypothetical protein